MLNSFALKKESLHFEDSSPKFYESGPNDQKSSDHPDLMNKGLLGIHYPELFPLIGMLLFFFWIVFNGCNGTLFCVFEDMLTEWPTDDTSDASVAAARFMSIRRINFRLSIIFILYYCCY